MQSGIPLLLLTNRRTTAWGRCLCWSS